MVVEYSEAQDFKKFDPDLLRITKAYKNPPPKGVAGHETRELLQETLCDIGNLIKLCSFI